MQSAVLRALKLERARSSSAPLALALAQVIVAEAMDRIEVSSHRLLPAVSDGDMLRTQSAMVRRLLKRDLIDTISLRRTIAAAAIESNRYPL
jgi:hypothetical protein